MVKQAVILAGGLGTRLSEETDIRPKPMVEIGGTPILVHIMNWYSKFGVTDFLILAGYKSEIIKSYFLNYKNMHSNLRVDLSTGTVEYFDVAPSNWKVSIFDTGSSTMTGGRLKRAKPYLDETFFLTYGDGVSDVDIDALLASHKKSGKSVTLTRVISPERFGVLELDGDKVTSFVEKPTLQDRWINGGYFVVNKEALSEIEGDLTSWEQDPLQNLASKNELNSFTHLGFWKPMDTLRDKRELEEMIATGCAPWLT